MKVYLLVGCPGSGKSWVANQLRGLMDYIPHDNFIKSETAYLPHIFAHLKAKTDKKPVLIESPFSISQLKDPLEQRGVNVEVVFIQEHDHILKSRYENREGKPIPAGHLTRQRTYAERAKEYGSFSGTSQQVLELLKSK
jgi:hypothetical protein